MSKADSSTFAAAISKLGLKETDLAVAMLWYEDHAAPGTEKTASDLAMALNLHALGSGVNKTRLNDRLRRNPDTVAGSSRGFKIRLSSRPSLAERYIPLLGARVVVVSHAYLPESQTKGTRPYLVKLAWQLNGCYEHGFYDACAVLCRRMVESLLIEAFESVGKGFVIRSGSDYKPLNDILGSAQSGHHIKLGRNTPKALDRIKAIGDTAAHDRAYITTKPDLADIAHDFRRTISELMGLANIHPTA